MASNGPGAQQDYNRAIRDLNSLQSNTQVLALAKYKQPESILPLFRRQLGLAGIEPGHLNKLNAIHISGTKGKGSTCALLERILMLENAQRKIGTYNSPHLVHVTERIRLNGRPIERPLFTKYFRHVFDRLKLETRREQISMPSYFAFLTILAFHVFLEERVDCSIIEVGIGGEYDPTNVLPAPVACAITTLDLDHTNILGNTIKRIAWTKAGIAKRRVPLFTIEHEQREALESIEARARERGAQVFICKPLDVRAGPSGQADRSLGICGPAQAVNAALACQLAKYYLSPAELAPVGSQESAMLETKLAELPECFRTGLRECRLAGRCQVIECPEATFFLDGAHTRKSMENCVHWFLEASASSDPEGAAQRILMVNVIGERDKGQVLQPLVASRDKFHRIIFTSNAVEPPGTGGESSGSADSDTFARAQDAHHERGLANVESNARTWADLTRDGAQCSKGQPKVEVRPSIMQTLESITGDRHTRRLHVLATGSLHFVGAVMRALIKLYPNKVDLP